MQIETDTAEILSGVRKGETLGSPVALLIRNRDWKNWQQTMHVGPEPPADATGAEARAGDAPAPGPRRPRRRAEVRPRRHARHPRARQRARDRRARRRRRRSPASCSPRFGVEIVSHVFALGAGAPSATRSRHASSRSPPCPTTRRCTASIRGASDAMIAAIDAARAAGDTLGGAFEVIVRGVPVGPRQSTSSGIASSMAAWRRPSCRFRPSRPSASASAPRVAAVPGSQVHDEIVLPRRGRRGARRSAWRARPTAPADSRAASPTARTCASPAT